MATKIVSHATSEAENITQAIQLQKILVAREAQEQLLMFLTRPAGAGKTTAVKAAQHFCPDFCNASGIRFDDNTFFFTACTGSSASSFGGRTILKAAQLPIKGSLQRLQKQATHEKV